MFTREERARMGAMWLAHLQGWRASGISLAEYARREGFDADGAYRWKRILRRTGQWVEAPAAAAVKSTQRSSPVQFARVAVNDGPPPAGMLLRLVLMNGRRAELQIEGIGNLKDVLGVLERAA